jgi:hypothetical protein
MAHSNVNAIIDPQLQYHDQRHGSHQYNHQSDARHGSRPQPSAQPHSHPQHGGVPYQLHPVHQPLQDPQLVDPQDHDDSVDGDDDSGHGSPEDAGDGNAG